MTQWTDERIIEAVRSRADYEVGSRSMFSPKRVDELAIQIRDETGEEVATAWIEQVSNLQSKYDAATKETGDLRQAITEAAGMPWIENPQPLGGMGYICPDDKRIVAFVANMAQEIAQGATITPLLEITPERTEALQQAHRMLGVLLHYNMIANGHDKVEAWRTVLDDMLKEAERQ